MLRDASLERNIMTTVDGFSAALALATVSDLIATVLEKYIGALSTGMFSFPLPVRAADFTISLLSHPRMDGDLAHHWLRNCVNDACRVGP